MSKNKGALRVVGDADEPHGSSMEVDYENKRSRVIGFFSRLPKKDALWSPSY
jgi:hypothetical protein